MEWEAHQQVEYALLALETVVDTDPATGHFVVHLQPQGGGTGSALLLATPDWAEMTMVRSDLNQLRAHCAGSLEPRD